VTQGPGNLRKNGEDNKNRNQITRLVAMCLTQRSFTVISGSVYYDNSHISDKITAFYVSLLLTAFTSDSLWCLLSPGMFSQCTTGVKQPWIMPSTCSLL